MVARGLSRDRLVAIAHEFVGEQGLDALTMRRLAAAAGVTPGALYKHVHDQRDLRRALADAVFATVDLPDVDAAAATAASVVDCFERLRAAMLAFRDGGRIVAGSYAPFAATARLGATVRALLADLVVDGVDAGEVAYVLRNYTVGFVIEEQAYLTLVDSGEWGELVDTSTPAIGSAGAGSDAVAILGGDRDEHFRSGLHLILRGVVRPRR